MATIIPFPNSRKAPEPQPKQRGIQDFSDSEVLHSIEQLKHVDGNANSDPEDVKILALLVSEALYRKILPLRNSDKNHISNALRKMNISELDD